MIQLLGLLLISFFITGFLLIPFIDLLFYLKRRFEKFSNKEKGQTNTPIHDQLMKGDENTPVGGGILLVTILVVLSVIYAHIFRFHDLVSLKIILFSLLSFGSLGLIDDVKWILTKRKGKFLGLSRKFMLIVQIAFALIISLLLYNFVGLNNIYIAGLGNFIIGPWFVPLSTFIIVSFANAFNISDGLDGLSTGLLTICLFAFLAITSTTLDLTLSSFIGIWIGTLLAYLYFNVYPARIFLGDMGALAFGATLAVVGLLTGKMIALVVIGGIYVVIVFSSLIQIFWKKFFKRKLLPVSPIHMYYKYIGWEEPKIVTRFWLAGVIFAILGLWLALLSR